MEKIKLEFSEDERQKALEVAAKEILHGLTHNDQQVKNLYGYMRERLIELPCDINYPEPSKSLRLRYNLANDYTIKMVFGIIEDWFNIKKEKDDVNGK